MKTTVKQLAEHCGVSIGTIDRVLNNRKGVSASTKELVHKAIVELHYSPNYMAKSLSMQRSLSIGVVLFNLKNSYFGQLAEAMVSEATQLGYSAYLMLSQKSKEQERSCIANLISRRVDGLILFSTNNDEAYLHEIKATATPVVTVSTVLGDLPSVGIDDRCAMLDATRYVLAHQYTRLIYISPPLAYTNMNIEVTKSRYIGFQQATAGTSTECITLTETNYLYKLEELLQQKNKKTAILCSSDIYSLDIVKYLKLRGLNTPYDYGILGFDNIDMLRYVEPAISTISVPISEIGTQAVELLVSAINGHPVQSKYLPHEIITGQTIV